MSFAVDHLRIWYTWRGVKWVRRVSVNPGDEDLGGQVVGAETREDLSRGTHLPCQGRGGRQVIHHELGSAVGPE